MIPENTLKFVVGVLLCAFGTFWVGEGMGLAWPGEDLAVVALNAGFLAAATVAIPMCKARAASKRLSVFSRQETAMSWLKTVWSEFIGLFVDDGSFAVAILAWLAACWLVLPRLPLPPALLPIVLFAGLALILVESALRQSRQES